MRLQNARGEPKYQSTAQHHLQAVLHLLYLRTAQSSSRNVSGHVDHALRPMTVTCAMSSPATAFLGRQSNKPPWTHMPAIAPKSRKHIKPYMESDQIRSDQIRSRSEQIYLVRPCVHLQAAGSAPADAVGQAIPCRAKPFFLVGVSPRQRTCRPHERVGTSPSGRGRAYSTSGTPVLPARTPQPSQPTAPAAGAALWEYTVTLKT